MRHRFSQNIDVISRLKIGLYIKSNYQSICPKKGTTYFRYIAKVVFKFLDTVIEYAAKIKFKHID